MIHQANEMVSSFLSGNTSKDSCPNLGLLLVATLISDNGLTEALTLAIIKEAIVRNVVWMLDIRGAMMPELAYLEPSAISEFRLKRTFTASLKSYRLLMFCSLFCRSARHDPTKSLAALLDDLFDAHGAPPRGMAAYMAREIRRIKTIDSFPQFLQEMAIKEVPTKSDFTAFLRKTITDSERAGYSRMPFTQEQALNLRLLMEPGVCPQNGGRLRNAKDLPAWALVGTPGYSFFPQYKKGKKQTGGQA